MTSPGADLLAPDAAAKVLGGFAGADLIAVEQPAGGALAPLAPATLAVLVTGGADGQDLDDVGKQRQQVALSLAAALDARSDDDVLAAATP